MSINSPELEAQFSNKEAEGNRPQDPLRPPFVEFEGQTISNDLLRQKLGLVEQPPVRNFEEKFDRVKEFVFSQTVSSGGGYFVRDGFADLQQQRLRDSAERKLGFIDQAQRKITVWNMGRSGIQDPESVMRLMETKMGVYRYENVPSARISELLRGIDETDQNGALRKLESAVDKLHQINFYPDSSYFHSEGFFDVVAVLSNTSPETFTKVVGEINQYPFIFNTHTLSDGDADVLADIFENGGLTEGQKQILDKEQIFASCIDSMSLTTESKSMPALCDVFGEEMVARVDRYLPYVVDAVDGRIDRYAEPRISFGRDFIENLDFLQEQGVLAGLGALDKAGWDMQGIYHTLSEISNYERDVKRAQLLKQIREAQSFASNTDNVGFVQICEELLSADYPSLSPNKVPLYRSMLEKQNDLTEVILFLNQLPNGRKIMQYAVRTERDSADIIYVQIGHHLEHLADQETMGDDQKIPEATEVDIAYAALARNLLSDRPSKPYSYGLQIEKSDLPWLAYLNSIKGDLESYIPPQYGLPVMGIKTKFIEGIVDSHIPLNDKMAETFLQGCRELTALRPDVQWHFWKNFSEWERVQITQGFPNEFVATLAESDQQFIHYVQSQPERVQTFLVAYKDTFGELYKNGMPTEFAVNEAYKRRQYDVVGTFLDDETIATFPPERQTYWQTFKTLPRTAQDVLFQSQTPFDQLFVNGQPTAAFVSEVVTACARNPNNTMRDLVAVIMDAQSESFTAEEQQYWSRFVLGSDNFKLFMFKNKDQYGLLFTNGLPNEEFLTTAFKSGYSGVVREVLTDATIEAFVPESQLFWRTFREAPNICLETLVSERELFGEFFIEGKPTATLLDHVVSRNTIRDATGVSVLNELVMQADIDRFGQGERAFWGFYQSADVGLKIFILQRREAFDRFVEDGKPKRELYLTRFAEESGFLSAATRDDYRAAFGEEQVNTFLDVLPKRTDEKRNAFTHNNYDRTSELISYLAHDRADVFKMNAEHFALLTPYVAQFGLARNALLFHYFSSLYRRDHDPEFQLPQDVVDTGVSSVAELRERLTQLQRRVFSEEQFTDLSGLRPFDYRILEVVTGKSTHRFDYGKPTMENIVDDFGRDMASGEIKSLPSAFTPVTLDVSKVRIEFDVESVRGDFDILQQEILGAIKDPRNISSLLQNVKLSLGNKLVVSEELLSSGMSRDGRPINTGFVEREITNMKDYLGRIEGITSADDLMVALLGMRFSDTEQLKMVNKSFRQIVFNKVFAKNFSPGALQEIETQLNAGITAGSIETVINVVDELAKTHALNIENNNLEQYWTDDAYAVIRKQGKNIPRSFSPHIGKLKESVEQFQKIETGSDLVRVIPDRGFVGEMSGYLADVCYTAEYPLLKKWPNVVPYKFVRQPSELDQPEFIGSVLLFTLQDSAGDPVLLMRAFDVPDESSMDITRFIEDFVDQVAVPAGRKLGTKKIIVPGNQGAISNYQMSINHIHQTYVKEKTPISLSEQFRFNGYDLTDNSFVVREIS